MNFVENFKIEELVEGLSRIIKINSEQTEPVRAKDGALYPFGKGVQTALEETLKLAKEMGFETYNCDNYGGHIDFLGTGEDNKAPKIFGILGHLDVVPAGSDWSHDPYGAEIVDGYMYGRGTTDDKGPLITCLYCMKALKDAGYQPKNTIRLILGLDEETNWKGMEYYFSKVPAPDFGFTPDAEFPIINGEKGMVIFDFAKKFAKNSNKGLELRTVTGGTASNAVADTCRAVLRNDNEKEAGYDAIKTIIEQYRTETGYKVNYKGVGKALEITTTGVAAHGAKPEAGLNAISIMMELLAKFNFVNESAGDFVDFYNKYIGFDLGGERLGIAMEDEKSGKLTLNVGLIDLDPSSAKLTINVRFPVTKTAEEVYEPLANAIEKYDIGVVRHEYKKPIFMDLDNPMVDTLLKIYREHTKDDVNQPLVIGGGTYAKAADNIIAYGGLFPGDEDLMHQKDERVSLERLKLMAEIYFDAIYELSK